MMIPRPTMARVLRLRKYHVRLNWAIRGLGRFPRGTGVPPEVVTTGWSSEPHTGVEVGVEDIDDDVRDHHDDREQQGRPEDEAVVVRGLDGEGEHEPDPLEAEDLLDDREPSDEAREGEPENGHRHVQGVTARVPAHDPRLADPLRTGGPDEVHVQNLEHAVPDEAEDRRDGPEGDHRRGDEHPEQGVPREPVLPVDEGVDGGESRGARLEVGRQPTGIDAPGEAGWLRPGADELVVRERLVPALWGEPPADHRRGHQGEGRDD